MKSSATPKSQTHAVNFRLDDATRQKVDSLSSSSDRSLAQLAKYALIDYFATHTLTNTTKIPAEEPVSEEDSGVSSGIKNLTVRLSDDLLSLLNAHCQASECTKSDLIRQALALWLASDRTSSVGSLNASGTGLS